MSNYIIKYINLEPVFAKSYYAVSANVWLINRRSNSYRQVSPFQESKCLTTFVSVPYLVFHSQKSADGFINRMNERQLHTRPRCINFTGLYSRGIRKEPSEEEVLALGQESLRPIANTLLLMGSAQAHVDSLISSPNVGTMSQSHTRP